MIRKFLVQIKRIFVFQINIQNSMKNENENNFANNYMNDIENRNSASNQGDSMKLANNTQILPIQQSQRKV